MSIKSGTLYVVATPIGNLQDLSPRAVETLAGADLILAEDTRHSGKLLQQFSIDVPVRSCHEHNEADIVPDIVAQLKAGSSVALISDAGLPLISDPGYRLVTAVHENQLTVTPIPGPSACVTALAAAGLPSDRFLFYGYLPARKPARIKALESLADIPATLIFYEAPHRIRASLQDAIAVFGAGRAATVARELTKIYEEIRRSDLAGCLDWLDAAAERSKGEFVLLIAGCAEATPDRQAALRILGILLQELPRRKAAEITARITGLGKNELYQLSLEMEK
ncbi:MAG: 16S rRNA (cytidine(1402)-2'-O)-methyltransferase [Thiotrichales bacterium]|nr:16S rRNA (cytidine(1402)-2'-O)-methyltransferase [Thiotrichales bacterium]